MSKDEDKLRHQEDVVLELISKHQPLSKEIVYQWFGMVEHACELTCPLDHTIGRLVRSGLIKHQKTPFAGGTTLLGMTEKGLIAITERKNV